MVHTKISALKCIQMSDACGPQKAFNEYSLNDFEQMNLYVSEYFHFIFIKTVKIMFTELEKNQWCSQKCSMVK